MDSLDRKILAILQNNARIPLKAIETIVNLSSPAISERIKKLEKNGIIKKYVTLIDREKLNKSFVCFCLVTLQSNTPEMDRQFVKYAEENPDILECHRIAGSFEYILKIATESPKTMEKIIVHMRNSENVNRTSTLTVLATTKEWCDLPLD